MVGSVKIVQMYDKKYRAMDLANEDCKVIHMSGFLKEIILSISILLYV